MEESEARIATARVGITLPEPGELWWWSPDEPHGLMHLRVTDVRWDAERWQVWNANANLDVDVDVSTSIGLTEWYETAILDRYADGQPRGDGSPAAPRDRPDAPVSSAEASRLTSAIGLRLPRIGEVWYWAPDGDSRWLRVAEVRWAGGRWEVCSRDASGAAERLSDPAPVALTAWYEAAILSDVRR